MNTKHFFAFLLAVMIAASTIFGFAAAQSIIISGEQAEIPPEMGSIKEADDRTFVPIRFVMEYLGCYVDFDDINHAATVSSDVCAYVIQEDNPELFIIPFTGEESTVLKMDTVPFIDQTEGRMYIPIRFLAEAIGYQVGWDEKTQAVTLEK